MSLKRRKRKTATEMQFIEFQNGTFSIVLNSGLKAVTSVVSVLINSTYPSLQNMGKRDRLGICCKTITYTLF
jgi:hypothetical protein